MLKTFTTVLLAAIFSASLVGCSNMSSAKKGEACCPDCEKETNNGKAVVTNAAKPNPATQPAEHQH
jgi:hypothetical protein